MARDPFDHLPLTFPRDLPRVAIGGANGVRLRYEVTHIKRGLWELEIEADGIRRTRAFTNRLDAEKVARDDFKRRQLLRVA